MTRNPMVKAVLVASALAVPATGLAQNIEYDTGKDFYVDAISVTKGRTSRPGHVVVQSETPSWGTTTSYSSLLDPYGNWSTSASQSTQVSAQVPHFCGSASMVASEAEDTSDYHVEGTDQKINVFATLDTQLAMAGWYFGACTNHYDQQSTHATGLNFEVPFTLHSNDVEVEYSVTTNWSQVAGTGPLVTPEGIVLLTWSLYEDTDGDGKVTSVDVFVEDGHIDAPWGEHMGPYDFVDSVSSGKYVLVVTLLTDAYASSGSTPFSTYTTVWDPTLELDASVFVQLIAP